MAGSDLPTEEPATSKFSQSRHGAGTLPVYLYAIVELDAVDVETLFRRIKQGAYKPDDKTVQLARPRYDFNGQSVRHVYNRHVSMFADLPITEPEELEFNYQYFAVVMQRDWEQKCILIINLEPEVDSFRLRPGDFFDMVANLEVGNMHWLDFKEWLDPFFHEDAHSSIEKDPGHSTGSKVPDSRNPRVSDDRPFNEWQFAIFPWGKGPKALTLVDEDCLKREPQSARILRAPSRDQQAVGDDGTWPLINYDWMEVVKRFRVMCKSQQGNAQFHKNLFIAADKAKPEKNGVLIARLNWDLLSVSFMNSDEILDLDVDFGQLSVQRVDPRSAYEDLCAIADSQKTWKGLDLSGDLVDVSQVLETLGISH